jgi:hypothetical protein
MNQVPNYFFKPTVEPAGSSVEPVETQGTFGDMVDSFQAGALSATGGIFDFVGAKGLATQFYGWSQDQNDQMSESGRASMGKSIFSEDENGDLALGEGASDLDTWLLSFANVAGQFLPTAIPGAGAAGLVTKAASLGKVGSKVATAAGMGFTGGSSATGQGMEQARNEIRDMPNKLKAESDIFKQLIRGVNTNNPELSAQEKWDLATEALADQVANEVKADPKVLLANFGASAIGDPIIGRALIGARIAKSGAFRSAFKGAAVEGSTEALQAGVQQYGINEAIQPIDNRDLSQGVKSAALNEGVIGGGFGGVAGFGGGLLNRQSGNQDAIPSAGTEGVDVTPEMQEVINRKNETVDPAVQKVKESNQALGEELEKFDQASARRREQLKKTVDLDIPTAARNAGAQSPADVTRFGQMIDSPIQEALNKMQQGRSATIENMIRKSASFKKPTEQDRFLPQKFTNEGDFLPGGKVAEQPARQINSGPIDGELESKPRSLPQGQTRIAQKDIVFAPDDSAVNVKNSGKAYKSPKEALISINARRAKREGAEIEAVPFDNGFGWRVTKAVDNEQSKELDAGSTEQSSDNQIASESNGADLSLPEQPITNDNAVIEETAQGAEVELSNNQEPVKKPNIEEPAKDLQGKAIDKEWVNFADDTGTKKIPRAEMPQIKAEHRGAMVNFMKGRDITHEQQEVEAASLKPTQAEFSKDKVKKAIGFEGGDRSILISSDNYVLDGHHQWLAKREKGESVKVIRLDAPIETLIPLAKEFPSSDTANESQANQEKLSTETVDKSVDKNTKPPTKDESPVDPINDFGEKIGGARKDNWGGFKETLDQEIDTKAEPLSRSFPQPDYKKLSEDGVSKESLAIIAMMRSELPAKPRDARRVARWSEAVNTARQFTQGIMKGTFTPKQVSEELRKSSGTMAKIGDTLEIIAEADPENIKSLADKYRIGSGSFSMFNGEKFDKSKVFYFVEINGRTDYESASESLDEVKVNLRKIIKNEGPITKGKKSKVSIFRDRYTKAVYLGWKGSSGVIRIQDFESVADAREHLNSNRDEVESKLAELKKTPKMRRPENRSRVGEPRIEGQVTPEIFSNTFGFRGVEFGNWVEQGKRQKDLNEAYDGLLDLADALDIPPKAISLNGELGLAFGARGVGGSGFAAHYEPGSIAINLTKKAGAGSLAHEWFHALDNYFSRMGGKSGYTTELPRYKRVDGVRPEMRKAFIDVMDAIDKTGIKKRSETLDKRKSKGYWATNLEMAARSFERYIIDKLESSDQQNDYLANIVSEDVWGDTSDTYPYPTNSEAKVINQAFDEFFDVIQTKEGENGNVILFNKSDSPLTGKPVSLGQAKTVTKDFIDYYAGLDDDMAITVTDKKPSEIFKNAKLEPGDNTAIKGGFDKDANRLYIFSANHSSIEGVRQTLREELLVHKGLEVFKPSDIAKLINTINGTRNSVNPKIKAIWKDIDRNYNDFPELVQAEEFLGKVAQIKPSALGKYWNQIVSSLTRLLRKVGLVRKGITLTEMKAVVAEIGDKLQQGQKPDNYQFNTQEAADSGLLLNRDNESAQSKSNGLDMSKSARIKRAESMGFDTSTVLYHGSKNDINEFAPGRAGVVFFSDDPSYSEMYGDKLYPVFLSLKNPADLINNNEHKQIIIDAFNDAGGWEEFNEDVMEDRDNPNYDESIDDMWEISDYVMHTLEDKGFDGVIQSEDIGDNAYVATGVFNPKNIRSVNAAFDPSDSDSPNIMLNRDTRTAEEKIGQGESTPDETVTEKTKKVINSLKSSDFWNRAAEGMFDGLHGIKQAEKANGIIDPAKMGYTSARLATGLGDMLHAVFHKGALEWKDGVTAIKKDTKGLLEVIGMLPEGEGLNNWLGWMAAGRAESLSKLGKENNLTKEDIATLKAKAKGNEALFEEVRQEYNKINSATLDLAQEAGLLSPEQRGAFDEEWYVPFFREQAIDNPELSDVVKQVTAPHTTKTGIIGQSAQIKELIGGKGSTKDLLENIIQRQVSLIDAAVKNNAAREVANNLAGTEYMVRDDDASIADAFNAIRVSRDDLAKNHQKVRIMEGGKPVYYFVSDAALLRGLMQVHDVGSKALFNKMARSSKRFLTAGITLSPDFIIRNFIRDAAHAWMVNKDGAKLGTDTWKGLKASWEGDDSYWDLIASGAAFQGGYIHGADPEAAQQQIRRALSMKGLNQKDIDGYMKTVVSTKDGMLRAFEKYRNASDKIENANRVVAFENALKAGKSRKEAIFDSKDLMDYSMKGNFNGLGTLIDMLPFFNARLQGMYKLGRAAAADGNDQIVKVLSKDLAMKGLKVAAFSTALAALNGDDERYKELPEWDKDAHWHFFLGAGDDGHIRIPKPFELGIIFGTLPERLFNFGAGNQSAGVLGSSVIHSITNTLALNPIPQLAMPTIEVIMNRSFFTGSPIEGLADQNREKSDRYSMNTSDTAKIIGQLSDAINLSPKQVQHLITGYSGTLGGYVLGMSDFIARSMTGRIKADTPVADWPIIKTLYQGGREPRSTVYQERFYESLQKAQQAYGSYKAAIDENDPERARDLFESRAEQLNARTAINRMQRQASKLGKQMRAIDNNKNLSSKEKRARLEALTRTRNELYEQAFTRLNLSNW